MKRRALAIWLALGLSPLPAFATPLSSQLIDQGIAHLERREHDEARRSFVAAVGADPADPEAAFFLGVALNRLGQGDTALAALRRSRALGGVNPDLAFETGWSLALTRDWRGAVTELSAYEVAHPRERPQADVFLARAHRELKEYDAAAAALTRAIAHDPDDKDLKDAVELERFRLAQARGDEKATAAALDAGPPAWLTAARRATAEGGGAGAAASPFFRPDEVRPGGARPVSPTVDAAGPAGWAALSLAAGYDSDARGVSPALRSQTAPGVGSAFADARLDAGYDLLASPERRLWLGYQLFERAYARQSIDSDLLDQEFSATFERQFGPSLRALAWVSDEYTLVDYADFRNQYGGGASLVANVNAGLRLEASYTYAHDDFLYPTEPVNSFFNPGNRNDRRFEDSLNRDAENHLASLALYWALPGTAAHLRTGYFHAWNFARRNDFDYEANGLFAGVTVPLPWDVTADVSYTRTLERYADVNEQRETPIHRRDPMDVFAVRLTRPLGPNVSAYVAYDLNRDYSNIDFYRYHQHVVSMGLRWQF